MEINFKSTTSLNPACFISLALRAKVRRKRNISLSCLRGKSSIPGPHSRFHRGRKERAGSSGFICAKWKQYCAFNAALKRLTALYRGVQRTNKDCKQTPGECSTNPSVLFINDSKQQKLLTINHPLSKTNEISVTPHSPFEWKYSLPSNRPQKTVRRD